MLELTERQEQIIRAAIHIISQNGLMGFSIRKLADRVGVTEAAIYRHFKNKADLMTNALEFMRANEEHATTWADRLPALDAIEKFHLDLAEFASTNPEVSEALRRIRTSHVYDHLSKEDIAIRRKHHSPVIKFINKGQDEGSIRSDISSEQIDAIIRRAMHGIVEEWHFSGRDFDLVAKSKATWEALRKMIEVIK